uniref:ADP-ribose glycohydrolase MACROD2-like n=1 Tax=Styela clava TaxID=7725 RepID=UPI001939B298|nr:ADP-ribose glycohydrolase MACROD2-like [Styela clava]
MDILSLLKKLKLLRPRKDIYRSRIGLWRGDITRLGFDAIVNAANRSLLGGGGVDGAIHAAAGKELLKECKGLNGCETGGAKITKGYKLPSKHVIHTVGPIGEDSELLSSCYENSLSLVRKHKLRSIAFPCISTGIYGYPNESAAHVALETTKNWLKKNYKNVDIVLFCLFMQKDVEIYNRLVEEYFPPGGVSDSQPPEQTLTSQSEKMDEDVEKPQFVPQDVKVGSDMKMVKNNVPPAVEENFPPEGVSDSHPQGQTLESQSEKMDEDVDKPQSVPENMEVGADTQTVKDDVPPVMSSSLTGDFSELHASNRTKRRSSDPDNTGNSPSDKPANIESNESVKALNKDSMPEAIDKDCEDFSMPTEKKNKQSSATDNQHTKDSVLEQVADVVEQPKKNLETKTTEGDNKETQQETVLSDENRMEWIEKFRSMEMESGQVITKDTESWAIGGGNYSELKRVGGLDISYHITRNNIACVTLVVLSFPDLEVIYEDTTEEYIDVPYISGYLAYREAQYFKGKLEKVAKTDFMPQIVIVDGNGLLHWRRYGSAVKFGIDCNIPSIGLAKNLLVMPELGIERDDDHSAKIKEMESKGSAFNIATKNGEILGKALRTSDESRKPVYVSIGHRCTLDTAVNVVLACCKHRLPEPIRQADQLSRKSLMRKYKEEYESYHKRKQDCSKSV